MIKLEPTGIPRAARQKPPDAAVITAPFTGPGLRGVTRSVPQLRKSNRFLPMAQNWSAMATTIITTRYIESTPAMSKRTGDEQMAL